MTGMRQSFTSLIKMLVKFNEIISSQRVKQTLHLPIWVTHLSNTTTILSFDLKRCIVII